METGSLIFGTNSARNIAISNPFIIVFIAEQIVAIEEMEQALYDASSKMGGSSGRCKIYSNSYDNGSNPIIIFSSSMMYGMRERRRSCIAHYKVLLNLRTLSRTIFKYLNEYTAFIEKAERTFLNICRRVLEKENIFRLGRITPYYTIIGIEVVLKYTRLECRTPRLRLKEPSYLEITYNFDPVNQMRVKTFPFNNYFTYAEYVAKDEVEDKVYKSLLKIEHLTSNIIPAIY